MISVSNWLATVNHCWELFNLLPWRAVGRWAVGRAYLWRRHGDSVRAGIGAARAGRVLRLVLIALRMAGFVAGSSSVRWLAFGKLVYLRCRFRGETDFDQQLLQLRV